MSTSNMSASSNMPIVNSQVNTYQPQNNIMHIKTTNNQLATSHPLGTNFLKSIMDLKNGGHAWKIITIMSTLRRLLEISISRIKGKEVVDVCRFAMSKVKDFDETMHVVQVRIGKLGMKDVLLDGGFGVNIIFKGLKKKLRLRRLQLTPFMVCMADQKKVQLIGLV